MPKPRSVPPRAAQTPVGSRRLTPPPKTATNTGKPNVKRDPTKPHRWT